MVAERFERERPFLQPLPAVPYDTAYYETRRVAWDGYIDVRGNRYSVPDDLVGQVVTVRIGLDDQLQVYCDDRLVAQYLLQARAQGWVSVPGHHTRLWQAALKFVWIQTSKNPPKRIVRRYPMRQLQEGAQPFLLGLSVHLYIHPVVGPT